MRTTLITVGLLALAATRLSAQNPKPNPNSKFPQCDFYNFGADRNEGRLKAKKVHSYGWFAGGASVGTVAPLIGPTIIAIIAYRGAPHPKTIPAEWNKPCYDEGFRVQSRNQHAVNAFVGGLAGTALGLFAVDVLHADDDIIFPLVPGKVGKN